MCEAITARKRARARADSVAREARAVIVRAGEHEDAFEKVKICIILLPLPMLRMLLMIGRYT